MPEVIYPVTPKNVDQSVIQPSVSFRQEVFRVLRAIIFFILVYIVLMAAALGLAALCAIGGISLIVAFPRFITLMIGIGLIGLGLLVVFFLLKFLFSSNKVDRSHLTEIEERDQPALFAFIRTLTRETQTPFPKRIYVSSDVNASVFYDSGFWSMFFPIRKNLQIGLGLVNSVNISEFKAILAHEFGHFSQRSMKLGSYVYNVNKIIYNMLYDNREYGKALEGFANVSSYFAIFANLTAWIISGIQSILQQVYAIVNKSYMSLSRQMEFHADSVAAYVSGSDHLVTSLRRLELANNSYQSLFSFYNLWFRHSQKPDNIYPQHSEVMQHLARQNNIPVHHGLPHVTSKTFAQFNKSRLVIKDQWASHPSTDDREIHLNSLNIHTEPMHLSAWVIFENPEVLQKQITEKIYETVVFNETPQAIDLQQFKRQYLEEVDKYKVSDRYKGFFDNRVISQMSYSKFDLKSDSADTLEGILNDYTLNLPASIDALLADIHVLRLISKRSVSIKTFEFDGTKRTEADATALVRQLESEVMKAEADLEAADKRIVAFFLAAAERHGKAEALRSKYNDLAEITKSGTSDLHRYNEMMRDLQPIYQQELEAAQVHQIMYKMRHNEEMIKDHLKKLLADPIYQRFFSEAERIKVEEYMSKTHVYFAAPNFNAKALALMNEATAIYSGVINDRIFSLKKEILEEQLTYLN